MTFGVPDFQVSRVRLAPPAGLAALPAGWLRLGILSEGQALLRHEDRQDLLRPGDGWVAAGEEGADEHCAWLTECRAILLALPAEPLRARALALPCGVWRLPADTPGLPLLGAFLGMVEDELARDRSPAFRAVIAGHVQDLAVFVVGACREGRLGALAAGPRAAKLRRAWEVIDRRLTDPALTPGSLAEALGVSVGYLGKLFAELGTTPAHQIRRLRLERAYAMLIDPAFAHHRPAEIAAACGIADFGTFKRAFRAEFGLPPGAVRKAP